MQCRCKHVARQGKAKGREGGGKCTKHEPTSSAAAVTARQPLTASQRGWLQGLALTSRKVPPRQCSPHCSCIRSGSESERVHSDQGSRQWPTLTQSAHTALLRRRAHPHPNRHRCAVSSSCNVQRYSNGQQRHHAMRTFNNVGTEENKEGRWNERRQGQGRKAKEGERVSNEATWYCKDRCSPTHPGGIHGFARSQHALHAKPGTVGHANGPGTIEGAVRALL